MNTTTIEAQVRLEQQRKDEFYLELASSREKMQRQQQQQDTIRMMSPNVYTAYHPPPYTPQDPPQQQQQQQHSFAPYYDNSSASPLAPPQIQTQRFIPHYNELTERPDLHNDVHKDDQYFDGNYRSSPPIHMKQSLSPSYRRSFEQQVPEQQFAPTETENNPFPSSGPHKIRGGGGGRGGRGRGGYGNNNINNNNRGNYGNYDRGRGRQYPRFRSTEEQRTSTPGSSPPIATSSPSSSSSSWRRPLPATSRSRERSRSPPNRTNAKTNTPTVHDDDNSTDTSDSDDDVNHAFSRSNSPIICIGI